MLSLVDAGDTSDPLNVRVRNPLLRNALVHQFEASLHRWAQGGRMWHVAGRARLARRQLVTATAYDGATGVRTRWLENASGNWDARVEAGGTVPLGGGWSAEARAEAQWVRQANRQNAVLTRVLSEGLQAGWRGERGVDAGVRLRGTWNRFKVDIRQASLQSSSQGEAAEPSAKFKRESFSQWQLGGWLNADLPWRLQVATDATGGLRRGYDDGRAELVWNVRLARRLLGGRLTVGVEGFDVLGSRRDVVQTVAADGRVERWRLGAGRWWAVRVAVK